MIKMQLTKELEEYKKRASDLISEGQNFKESTARAYMNAKKSLKGCDGAEKVIEDNEKIIAAACGDYYGDVYFETTPSPDDEFKEWFIVHVLTGDIEYGGHTCVYGDYHWFEAYGMSGRECPVCGNVKLDTSDY